MPCIASEGTKNKTCPGLHQEYAKLIKVIPESTEEYYDMKEQSDVYTRFWLCFKLCEHHRGEQVQISHRDNRWHLSQGRCPEPSVPAQFRCHHDWLVASRGAASSGCVSQTDMENYYLELGRIDGIYIKSSSSIYSSKTMVCR